MPGKSINVKNATELASAIKLAKGGETILLAPGDYGAVTINARAMTSMVTIKSADAAHDAVLTDLSISRSSNFAFEDLDVHHLLADGEADFTAAINIGSSAHIALNGIDITGTMDNDSNNDGVGMRITASSNIMVANSSFEQLNRAAVFSRDSGLVVAGNNVSHVREGFDFNAVHHVVIEKNVLTDIVPNFALKEHPDAIQFWNAGVKEGSSDVVIRNNTILTKSGNYVQGIFIGGEDPEYRHSNFLIENNLYNGDARNGIALGRVDDAVIRGNTLATTANGLLETAIRLDDSSRVVIDKNISPLIVLYRNTAITQTNNIDVWDVAQKKGIAAADLFTDTSPGKVDQYDFTIRAGSAAAKIGAGFHSVADVGIAKALAPVYDTYHAIFDGPVATMHLV